MEMIIGLAFLSILAGGGIALIRVGAKPRSFSAAANQNAEQPNSSS